MAIAKENVDELLRRMKIKNAQILQRHLEIEADKQQAARANALVSKHVSVNIEDMMPAERAAWLEKKKQSEERPKKKPAGRASVFVQKLAKYNHRDAMLKNNYQPAESDSEEEHDVFEDVAPLESDTIIENKVELGKVSSELLKPQHEGAVSIPLLPPKTRSEGTSINHHEADYSQQLPRKKSQIDNLEVLGSVDHNEQFLATFDSTVPPPTVHTKVNDSENSHHLMYQHQLQTGNFTPLPSLSQPSYNGYFNDGTYPLRNRPLNYQADGLSLRYQNQSSTSPLTPPESKFSIDDFPRLSPISPYISYRGTVSGDEDSCGDASFSSQFSAIGLPSINQMAEALEVGGPLLEKSVTNLHFANAKNMSSVPVIGSNQFDSVHMNGVEIPRAVAEDIMKQVILSEHGYGTPPTCTTSTQSFAPRSRGQCADHCVIKQNDLRVAHNSLKNYEPVHVKNALEKKYYDPVKSESFKRSDVDCKVSLRSRDGPKNAGLQGASGDSCWISQTRTTSGSKLRNNSSQPKKMSALQARMEAVRNETSKRFARPYMTQSSGNVEIIYRGTTLNSSYNDTPQSDGGEDFLKNKNNEKQSTGQIPADTVPPNEALFLCIDVREKDKIACCPSSPILKEPIGAYNQQ